MIRIRTLTSYLLIIIVQLRHHLLSMSILSLLLKGVNLVIDGPAADRNHLDAIFYHIDYLSSVDAVKITSLILTALASSANI